MADQRDADELADSEAPPSADADGAHSADNRRFSYLNLIFPEPGVTDTLEEALERCLFGTDEHDAADRWLARVAALERAPPLLTLAISVRRECAHHSFRLTPPGVGVQRVRYDPARQGAVKLPGRLEFGQRLSLRQFTQVRGAMAKQHPHQLTKPTRAPRRPAPLVCDGGRDVGVRAPSCWNALCRRARRCPVLACRWTP